MAVISDYQISDLNQTQLDYYQLYLDLAVNILKSQNPSLIKHLKNFFVYLLSPTEIEHVFQSAIKQLAETDEDKCRWILQNPNFLMPEIDLIDLAKTMTKAILEAEGFVLGRDFKFHTNGQLFGTQAAIKYLLNSNYNKPQFNENKLFILLKEEILLTKN